MRNVSPAAKRRKSTAHGASRGWEAGSSKAPEERKSSYDTDSGGTAQFSRTQIGQLSTPKKVKSRSTMKMMWGVVQSYLVESF